MYLCPTYLLAVIFCVVTMFCWGSWANAQKLVNKKWRYELFYWDYVFGVLAASLVFAYTMGSHGQFGRSFIEDVSQADSAPLCWAFAGGIVFNIANILLVAAIDIAGMSVAFPVGIGLALVLGVIWNYLSNPMASGNACLLFTGVALVAVAIILSALSYSKRDAAKADASSEKKPIGKGLFLALLCGLLMSLFYFFVAKSLAPVLIDGKPCDVTLANLQANGSRLANGKLTPYTANVLFAVGVLVSNCVIMPILMRKPFVGEPVEKGAYGKGEFKDHFWGWVGGIVWAIGMTLNVIASGVASAAVAYGLGQGATLMSAIWGVFIWREFKGAPKGVGKILTAMFACFIVGLALIIWTKLDAPSAAPAPDQSAIEVPEFSEAMESKDDLAPDVEDGALIELAPAETDATPEDEATPSEEIAAPEADEPAAPEVDAAEIELPAESAPAEEPAADAPEAEAPATPAPSEELPELEIEEPAEDAPAAEPAE
ncbi:MAG: hypothetical protein IJU03_00640 [Thermoguttaceae bacterium]|nr:hypothetical protein [Thermoguttaceae bacterium]